MLCFRKSVVRTNYPFIIIIASIVLMSAQLAHSATLVSSALDIDTQWIFENSPYLITTDLTVPTGITLTIESGYDEATFTIYDPDGRFFTGGGYILDPYSGDHNNFGLTFRFNKRGKAQSNVIYMIRDKAVGVKIRIKSNRLESAGFPPGDPVGTLTAIADGKCNIVFYDLETDEILDGEQATWRSPF